MILLYGGRCKNMHNHPHFQVGKNKKRRRRRKKLKFGKYVKSGAKPRGTVDEKRTEKRASVEEKVEEAMQHLKNPFDEMSINEKKDLALFLCKRRLKVCDIPKSLHACIRQII